MIRSLMPTCARWTCGSDRLLDGRRQVVKELLAIGGSSSGTGYLRYLKAYSENGN